MPVVPKVWVLFQKSQEGRYRKRRCSALLDKATTKVIREKGWRTTRHPFLLSLYRSPTMNPPATGEQIKVGDSYKGLRLLVDYQWY